MGGQLQADLLAQSVGQQLGFLQIRQETATRLVVRVADIVAAQHALAGNVAAP
ncbi:hypothetical protein D3C83_246770 [compost metagenome]